MPLWPSHHAETLELILRHVKLGDQVFVLSCNGALYSCPANPFHDLSLCTRCKRQTSYSIHSLLKDQVKDIRLPDDRPHIKVPAFDSLEDLGAFTQEDVPFGEMSVSQLVDENKDSYIDIADFRGRAEALIQSSMFLYFETQKIIRENLIDKVYAWNGRRSSDGPVLYAAKNLGVDYNCYISGGKRNHFISRKMLKHHSIEDNKRILQELYNTTLAQSGYELIEKDADTFFQEMRFGGGKYPGFIHFAKNFSNNRLTEPNSEKIPLAIFTSSFWEFFAMKDYLHRYPPYKNHHNALSLVLNDPVVRGLSRVVVRWHPHLAECGTSERKKIDELIANSPPNVMHILPEDNLNSYSLIDAADKVVSFGSTVGVEASYYGKPSILLGRSIYEDSGAVYVPKDHDEAMQLISAPLEPLPKLGAVKYGFWFKNMGNEEFNELYQDDQGVFFVGQRPLVYNYKLLKLRKTFSWLSKVTGLYPVIQFFRKKKSETF